MNKEIANQILTNSGILDAYEYVIRNLVNLNLPDKNYFKLCSKFILEFEIKAKEQNIRQKSLKELVNLELLKDESTLNEKTKINLEKDLKNIVQKNIVFKTKVLSDQYNNIQNQYKNTINIDDKCTSFLNINNLENELNKRYIDTKEKVNIFDCNTNGVYNPKNNLISNIKNIDFDLPPLEQDYIKSKTLNINKNSNMSTDIIKHNKEKYNKEITVENKDTDIMHNNINSISNINHDSKSNVLIEHNKEYIDNKLKEDNNFKNDKFKDGNEELNNKLESESSIIEIQEI